MNSKTLKYLEFVGAAVFILGLTFWYSTPGNVIVVPIVIMAAGGIMAGVPWLIRRRQDDRGTKDLVERQRAERQRADGER